MAAIADVVSTAAIAAGLVTALLGVPLLYRRVPPNRWYGVRTPATLRSKSRWYRVNTYGGRRLLLAGLAAILAGAVIRLSGPDVLPVMALAAIGSYAFGVLDTLRFAVTDRD